MTIPSAGWKNKAGTAGRACNCGSWKSHWIKYAKKPWPQTCSVSGCESAPTVGAHVINPGVTGERIVPMCDSCNKLSGSITLKFSISVPSANQAETCGKP